MRRAPWGAASEGSDREERRDQLTGATLRMRVQTRSDERSSDIVAKANKGAAYAAEVATWREHDGALKMSVV